MGNSLEIRRLGSGIALRIFVPALPRQILHLRVPVSGPRMELSFWHCYWENLKPSSQRFKIIHVCITCTHICMYVYIYIYTYSCVCDNPSWNFEVFTDHGYFRGNSEAMDFLPARRWLITSSRNFSTAGCLASCHCKLRGKIPGKGIEWVYRHMIW